MTTLTLDHLTEQLELADEMRVGRDHMLDPQDLPGRFGRVIRAVDHLLQAMDCPAVVAGGWAVWRHGYVGRVTEDVDIVLPADRIDEFLNAAAFSGFERLPVRPGNWPKVRHKESDITVDVLPEGATPGTASRLMGRSSSIEKKARRSRSKGSRRSMAGKPMACASGWPMALKKKNSSTRRTGSG